MAFLFNSFLLFVILFYQISEFRTMLELILELSILKNKFKRIFLEEVQSSQLTISVLHLKYVPFRS